MAGCWDATPPSAPPPPAAPPDRAAAAAAAAALPCPWPDCPLPAEPWPVAPGGEDGASTLTRDLWEPKSIDRGTSGPDARRPLLGIDAVVFVISRVYE